MAYSIEFKKQVVEEFRSGKTITEVSDKYSLAPSTVFFWNKNYDSNERYYKYGRGGHLTCEQINEKCNKLEKENKRLNDRICILEKEIDNLLSVQRKIKNIFEEK